MSKGKQAQAQEKKKLKKGWTPRNNKKNNGK